jgi:hypothetical protein
VQLSLLQRRYLTLPGHLPQRKKPDIARMVLGIKFGFQIAQLSCATAKIPCYGGSYAGRPGTAVEPQRIAWTSDIRLWKAKC